MYPLRFDRIKKNYIWGNEFWEISDRMETMSSVANGPCKGMTLQDLIHLWKENLLGFGSLSTRFPLLIKIIDAQETLSLQVHPNEENAFFFQGEAKSESWVMLRESTIYAGMKKGTTKQDCIEAIAKNSLEKLVEKKQVQKRDAYYIPAGMVHAIGGGSLLLEIQQNSDTTYRLYDWGRTSRPLHIDRGLASIDWNQHVGKRNASQTIEKDSRHQLDLLVESPYFIVERLVVHNQWEILMDHKTFYIIFCEEGEGTVISNKHREPLFPYRIYLIPAGVESISFEGSCSLICVHLK